MRKIEKSICYFILPFVAAIKPGLATKVYVFFLKRWGMQFKGRPNYISSKIWFDGTDYSIIHIGEGVTMSSYIRVLTHDWALHTVSKAIGIFHEKPLGRIKGITIGDYSFVGTGSIIMPGTVIGKGCIIGSGTVVRGNVPDFSIYIGSPGQVIGDTREYLKKFL